MNPSQRNTALVFLAAIALVAISEFVNGTVTLVLVILLLMGISFAALRRLAKTDRIPGPKLLPKMFALCGAAAIGYFGIAEFTDIQCRHLVTFTQAVNAAQSSLVASHLLGSPIRVSWPIKAGNGSNLSNEPGQTHLLIPVSGTHGYAKLVADGITIAGTWHLTNLQLVQNGTVTQLISPPAIH